MNIKYQKKIDKNKIFGGSKGRGGRLGWPVGCWDWREIINMEIKVI